MYLQKYVFSVLSSDVLIDDQVVFSLTGLLVFALLIIILSVTVLLVRWHHRKKLRYIFLIHIVRSL